MKKIFFAILLIALLAATPLSYNAKAAASTDGFIYGTITAINLDGTVAVTTSSGSSYNVTPAIGTDPTTLVVGSLVRLASVINPDGSISVTGLALNTRTNGYFCSQSTDLHPAGEKFAAQFEADSLYLQWMFCNDGMGWGEIKNMLRFSQLTSIDPATLQAARLAGEGWGQIRKEFNVPKSNMGQGKPEQSVGSNGNSANGNHGNSNNGNHGKNKP